MVTQIIDIAPGHPALRRDRVPAKRLLIRSICLLILFCMIIRMARKLIEIATPRETLRGDLIMSCGFDIIAGCRCFLQLGITRGNERRKDRQEKQNKNVENTEGTARHGSIIRDCRLLITRREKSSLWLSHSPGGHEVYPLTPACDLPGKSHAGASVFANGVLVN